MEEGMAARQPTFSQPTMTRDEELELHDPGSVGSSKGADTTKKRSTEVGEEEAAAIRYSHGNDKRKVELLMTDHGGL